jgi:flagellin
VSGTGIQIETVANQVAAPVVADVSGATTWSGGTSAPGAADDTAPNVSFSIDGNPINLSTDYTGNFAGFVSAVDTALGAGYTVTAASANTISIVNDLTGVVSTAPAITGADAAIFGTGTSVNGAAAGANTPGAAVSSNLTAALAATSAAAPLVLAAGEFSVQVGTGSAVAVLGSFDNGQELADEINTAVNGAYASFDTTTNSLTIASTSAVTITGTRSTVATGNVGFATPTATVTDGSLTDVNVRSAASANETMLRVDAALTSVSTLRSTLGAIQNRFQSTINSLQAVAENLSASRGRIQDTDFAMETANLTRAQILQQAGTAMVAQANSAPQNVLSLLRG